VTTGGPRHVGHRWSLGRLGHAFKPLNAARVAPVKIAG
jgi:hypothetical protein